MSAVPDSLLGEFLNPEQRALIWAAAKRLQAENKMRRLEFWGRVAGVCGDLFVLRGHTSHRFRDLDYFYSTDLAEWFKLPRVEPEAVRLAQDCTTLFTAIPSHVANFRTPADAQSVRLKEEARLSATVAVISNETSIIPRAAFFLDATNVAVKNKMFKGLSVDECAEPDSYVHFEELRGSKGLFPLLHSPHSIKQDFPPGWSVKQEGEVGVVRSLVWPGLTFHHQPDTPFYGWTYFGDGRRNWDFCSML